MLVRSYLSHDKSSSGRPLGSELEHQTFIFSAAPAGETFVSVLASFGFLERRRRKEGEGGGGHVRETGFVLLQLKSG